MHQCGIDGFAFSLPTTLPGNRRDLHESEKPCSHFYGDAGPEITYFSDPHKKKATCAEMIGADAPECAVAVGSMFQVNARSGEHDLA